jgi:hypothetical protein
MDELPNASSRSSESLKLDPTTELQLQRLHRLTVYSRWLVVLLLWLTVGAWSLWQLSYNIGLMQEHFTWAALRYGLHFNPLPTLGLSLCIGMTAAVLVWQSRNILYGLPAAEKERLIAQLRRIINQGESHPLWKWVCQPSRVV